MTQLVVFGLPVECIDGNEEGEHARAFDVTQELQPQPLSLMRPFDDAGNIGHHERAVIREGHNAEVGLKRGKRVVGNFWAGRRDDGEQGGLSGVRLPHQADVCNEFEFEFEGSDFSLFAGLPFAWRLMRGRGEEGISLSAASGLGDDEFLSMVEHLAQIVARLLHPNTCARGDGENEVIGRTARLVVPHPVLPTVGRPLIAVGVVEQRGEVGVGADDDISPAAAVSTVGTSHGIELLPPKGGAPGSAITCGDPNDDQINEHCC